MDVRAMDSGMGDRAPSRDEREERDEREQRLRARALRYLAARDRTRQEMERKLSAKEPDAELVGRVLAWLEERGYVDDRRFVEQWVRSRRETSGPRKLAFELQAKGVPARLVQEHLQAHAGDGEDDEYALRLIRRRLERTSSFPSREPAERQRLWRRSVAFLLRRGYSYDVARRAVETALRGTAEGPDDPSGEGFPFVDSP